MSSGNRRGRSPEYRRLGLQTVIHPEAAERNIEGGGWPFGKRLTPDGERLARQDELANLHGPGEALRQSLDDIA